MEMDFKPCYMGLGRCEKHGGGILALTGDRLRTEHERQLKQIRAHAGGLGSCWIAGRMHLIVKPTQGSKCQFPIHLLPIQFQYLGNL